MQAAPIQDSLLSSTPVFVEESRHRIQVSWAPPSNGALKLNVDGSHLHHQGMSVCWTYT